MVTKTSKEDVDAALKEQLRKGEGQKEQAGKGARRPKKNTEETTQMTKLVMVGEIQKIFEQAMLIIRDFLTSDMEVLVDN